MSDEQQSATDDELGPVDFLVVEFPDGKVSGSGFAMLLDLADRGVVGILDLEFVSKGADGSVERVGASDLALPDGVDLTVWDGASSGLLDDDDVAELGSALGAGSVAVAIVFENRWVLGIADAWRREGARLIADGGISADDLVAALDATEQR